MPVVVVVARVEPGMDPPYVPHARATCAGCPEWVWLGKDSYDLVVTDDVVPLCLQCAQQKITDPAAQIGTVND